MGETPAWTGGARMTRHIFVECVYFYMQWVCTTAVVVQCGRVMGGSFH